MISRLKRRTEGATSASVAIGTATGFVLLAACVSLLVDRGDAGPGIVGPGWTLRGTVSPVDAPSLERPKRASLPTVRSST